MPTVHKLMTEEVTQLNRRGARVDLSAYREALRELEIGDWGSIELEPDDKVTTVKRWATTAAGAGDAVGLEAAPGERAALRGASR